MNIIDLMYLKIHINSTGKIVAMCDKELIGKVLDDGIRTIDLNIYRNFYIGKIVTKEEVFEAFKDFNSANIVGKKSVDEVMKLGLFQKSQIMWINDVPYIYIFRV